MAPFFRPALLLALCVATAAASAADGYTRRDLVANRAALGAEQIDPNLVNAWGLAFNPYGVAWVADNGTALSTLYDGEGHAQTLVVQIPPAAGSGQAKPTGIVFYGGNAFTVHGASASAPARFIFASEDGGISAWAPGVDLTHAVLMHSTEGAIYKGLAISGDGQGSRLYATDFHQGKIDVFDADFHPVALAPRAFFDPRLPKGYAPFGIQAINGDLYVTYAKQDADREDDVAGAGFGFVDVYTPQGRLLRRFASRGMLNAPWGMALAPAGFGPLAGRLLIGNFGDGSINAYDLATGHFVGRLRGADHHVLHIEGLWGLDFGNGIAGQPVDTLFFTAGPNDEADGLYGRIDPAGDDEAASQAGDDAS
ncbi:MAG: TIGR03118 family protein [Telluria sp.]